MDAARWAESIPLGTPGQPEALFLRLFRALVEPTVRACHRPTLAGTEHLPGEGAYLLIANHSGGLAVAEIFSFAAQWLRAFGLEKPIAGFAHPFAFHIWPTSWILPRLGAVPSSYAAGRETLARGIPMLVFPGGDHESMRPVWQASRVDFGGRMGFLRMAREAWVPVVPMGIRGSHFTAPMLWRSRVLPYVFVWPRAVGIKRWPLTLLGALGAGAAAAMAPAGPLGKAFAAWAVAGSPLAMMPWIPATIGMQIGEAISPEELFGSRESGDEVLPAALERVQAAVQRLVRGG